jgi:hypothetical protein
MAANRVEIQVRANTKQAEKGLKNVEGRMKGMKGAAGGLTTGFNNFNKMLGAVGLGTVAVGAVATNLVSRYQDLKSAAASTKLIMLQLGGPDAVDTFEGLKDQIHAIADEYGITEAAAEEAYGNMAGAALDSTPDMNAFAAAVGLAETNGGDLNQTARDFGEALKGNVGPLEGHLKLIGDLDQAYRNIELTAKESKSWFDILSANTQNFVDDVLRGNWTDVLEGLSKALLTLQSSSNPALKIGLQGQTILGQYEPPGMGDFINNIVEKGQDKIGDLLGLGPDPEIGSKTSQKFLLGKATNIDASWARNVARQQHTKKTQFATSSMRTMSHFMGEGAGITSANPVYVNLKTTLNPAEVHRALDVEALASARAGISQAQSPYNPSWGLSGFSPVEYGR